MNIFIIEDNPFFRKKLVESITSVITKKQHVCTIDEKVITAQHLLQQDLTNGPNIYFLDIELKEKVNGIELGEKIREIDIDGYIVYISNIDNKLKEIVDKHIFPITFIEKQLSKNIFMKKLETVLEKIIQLETLREDSNYFWLQLSGQKIKIWYHDILYFEKIPRAKKVKLITENGMYTINRYLNDVKKELEESQFIFLNSFVIRINAIRKINSKEDSVEFKNGEEIFVGKHTFRRIKLALK
ncbi:TPA: LytR/AlgR family response regulator transcription factor [Enterococcus faecalis]